MSTACVISVTAQPHARLQGHIVPSFQHGLDLSYGCIGEHHCAPVTATCSCTGLALWLSCAVAHQLLVVYSSLELQVSGRVCIALCYPWLELDQHNEADRHVHLSVIRASVDADQSRTLKIPLVILNLMHNSFAIGMDVQRSVAMTSASTCARIRHACTEPVLQQGLSSVTL